MTRTVIDNGSVVLKNECAVQELVTTAAADTLAEGTILARDSVSGYLVTYVIGGSTNENGIPKCVLTHELVAAGAGQHPAVVLTKGVANSTRLVVDADGDNSNITPAILDQLRDYGIASKSVKQLSVEDN